MPYLLCVVGFIHICAKFLSHLMQAGMHHIAVNVIVHNHYNNIKLRISCVFMFVYNGLKTLSGVFILHLLRKARGCCMHVFSSYMSEMPMQNPDIYYYT